MSDIAILKDMINPEATVCLEDYHNKKVVKLSEPFPGNYSVTIFGMPDEDQSIAIKADAFTAPKKIFSDSKHQCKRADFVIITESNDERFVLCIELKAGQGGSEADIIKQLKGAKCFVSYCREIGKEFWENPTFLEDYQYRFVSIRHINIPKQPTRHLRKNVLHDHPKRMLKITSTRGLQFKKLVTGK